MQFNMTGETIESLLCMDNKPILELKIFYPQIMGPLSKESEYHFNGHYRTQARKINRQARTVFYHRAEEEAKMAAEQEFDFTLHSFIRTCSTMRLDSRYTSVVFDRYYYCGGTHGTTVRTANTWDLSMGRPVPLSYFFSETAPYRKIMLNAVCEQIEQQKKREEIFFFENLLQNARQSFCEKNYYLTGSEIVVYYPLYSLAPYHAGILSYKIPFSLLDGLWHKGRMPAELPSYQDKFASGFGTEFL